MSSSNDSPDNDFPSREHDQENGPGNEQKKDRANSDHAKSDRIKHDHAIERELDTEPPMMLPPDLASQAGAKESIGNSSERSLLSESDSKQNDSLSQSSNRTTQKISIPGFKILRELGRGGMGAVFLAVDESLNRNVALKIVSQSLVGSSGLRDRFDAEVKTLASLQHSNIAQLYSAGLTGTEPYFAMEFIDGSTLDHFAPEPMQDVAAAELMIRLCDAVEYCHQQGVIHRDLKPSNILMTKQGQPKIADFGLAKALHSDDTSTKTGEILGTPGYMSPEQAGGVVKQIGPSCDVYGLGAILFRLLTGRAPFVSPEPFQTVIQVLSEDPIAPRNLNRSVTRDLETICLKCLEKKTNKRYASVKELQEDLQRFIDGKPILARPNSWIQISGKWMRRNPALSVAISAVLVVIVGAITGLIMHNSVLSDELERSSRLSRAGSDFAMWAAQEHLNELIKLNGTTPTREKLIERVSEFLESSYADMPDDPIYTRRLGFTYAQLGATYGAGGQDTARNLEKARSYLDRALELYDRVEKLEPSAKLARLKIEAMLAMADLEGSLGNFKSKEQFVEKAKSLLDQGRDETSESVNIELLIMKTEVEQKLAENKFKEALESLKPLLKAVDRLEEFKDRASQEEAVNQRIVIWNYRSTCEKNLNNYPEAEKSIREMVRLAEKAFEGDPDNLKFQSRLAATLQRLGDIVFEQKKPKESLKIYERSADLARQRARENPFSVDAQFSLGIALSRLASNQKFLENYGDASQSIQEAVDGLEALTRLGKKELQIDQEIILNLQILADLEVAQTKFEAATKRYSKHRQSCEKYMESYDDHGFALNQLAENELSQSLMKLQIWNSKVFDLNQRRKPREESEYKQITGHLAQGISYFQRFEKIRPLDINQQSNLQSLIELQKYVEEYVRKIEALEDK